MVLFPRANKLQLNLHHYPCVCSPVCEGNQIHTLYRPCIFMGSGKSVFCFFQTFSVSVTMATGHLLFVFMKQWLMFQPYEAYSETSNLPIKSWWNEAFWRCLMSWLLFTYTTVTTPPPTNTHNFTCFSGLTHLFRQIQTNIKEMCLTLWRQWNYLVAVWACNWLKHIVCAVRDRRSVSLRFCDATCRSFFRLTFIVVLMSRCIIHQHVNNSFFAVLRISSEKNNCIYFPYNCWSPSRNHGAQKPLNIRSEATCGCPLPRPVERLKRGERVKKTMAAKSQIIFGQLLISNWLE